MTNSSCQRYRYADASHGDARVSAAQRVRAAPSVAAVNAVPRARSGADDHAAGDVAERVRRGPELVACIRKSSCRRRRRTARSGCAREWAGPRPSHSARCGALDIHQCPVHVERDAAHVQHLSIVEPCAAARRTRRSTDRWIVTQSSRRFGSITVSHTRSVGASISILTWTVSSADETLTGSRRLSVPRAARLASHSRSACSIAASSECSRTPSSSAARSSRGSRSLVQALHQRPDQLVLLAGDQRRRHGWRWGRPSDV